MNEGTFLRQNVHANCVALDADRGLLIIGASGAGKSGLSLTLMAMGLHLVTDDRTWLTRDADTLVASAPPAIENMIEARGLGLLHATALPQARIQAVVNLSQVEPHRLPPSRKIDLLGLSIPLFLKVEAPHFAPALIQWLKGGRCA